MTIIALFVCNVNIIIIFSIIFVSFAIIHKLLLYNINYNMCVIIEIR